VSGDPEGPLAWARWTTEHLVAWTERNRGLLPRAVDTGSGAVLDPEPPVEELGDVMQNVAALGVLSGRADYVDWAVTQSLRQLERTQSERGFVVPDARRWSRNLRPAPTIRNVDTLTGLVALGEIVDDERLRARRERLLGAASEAAFAPYLAGWAAPLLPFASSLVAGQFAEELVRAAARLHEPVWGTVAEEMLRAWCELEYFREHGLFPLRVPLGPHAPVVERVLFRARGRLPSDSARLVKDNVALGHALLALWRHAGRRPWLASAYARWSTAVENTFVAGAAVPVRNAWHPRGAGGEAATLATVHPLVELRIDEHVVCGGSTLAWVRDAIEHLRALGDAEGGLPESLLPASDTPCLLDPQLDLLVNAAKLAQLDGDEKRNEECTDWLARVLRRHRREHGFAWSVGWGTGRPLDDRIETKFLGLVVKVCLALHHASEGDDLLGRAGDDGVYGLVRDR
jgi:hypothetical protein